MKWISINKRIPERWLNVLTLLYKNNGYEMCMNSVQGRHVQEANGNLLTVYQWENENLRVTHWLEGLPNLPKLPKEAKELTEQKSGDCY